MASHFEAAPLVASPSHPNSIAWSDENLVAVASGHLVTILNPSLLIGPRGLITIPASIPFPIGVVKSEDLLTACLMPTCLSRDIRPCARSISWSHPGLASNSGCLLAVCTTEGHVKLYRSPFCEFCAEWVEVIDISEMLYDYFVSVDFEEFDMPSTKFSYEQTTEHYYIESGCASDFPDSVSSKGPKQRKAKKSKRIIENTGTGCGQVLNGNFSYRDTNNALTTYDEKLVSAFTEVVIIPCSNFKLGSAVEILKQDDSERIWINGIIKNIEGAKALVLFPETTTDGEQDKWVDLVTESNIIEVSSMLDGTTSDQGSLLPNIRPSMSLANFSEQILLAERHGVEEFLRVGQIVEALLSNRWVEGLFMGFNGCGLLVKLSGNRGCVIFDPSTVRLAPLWDCDKKSWHVTLVKLKVEKKVGELHEVVEIKSGTSTHNNPHPSFSVPRSEGKWLKKGEGSDTLPIITAAQYASRNAMLSSLVVAWSPVLQLPSESGLIPPITSSNNCAVLAVGGKSGKISFWRIHEPDCYTIEHGRVSVDVMLVGLLQAHKSWITAISWGLYAAEASNSQILLATGSSDGSVKIWLVNAEGLIKTSGVNNTSFSLLKEVIAAVSAPVSALSMAVPVQSVDKVLLAVGKGSGSLEVWICYISCSKFQNVGVYDAHDQVVTGLSWAFDGGCLYSCSQDNFVRSWILHGTALNEVPFPSNSPGLKSPTDLAHAFDSCLGLAISPGNLVIAVARSFDADLLNPMYQARTQKAAVEFFWIGGQQLEVSSGICSKRSTEAFLSFSERDYLCWESKILWSLKLREHVGKPLVLWDVIAALLAFKQSGPSYVEQTLCKWVSSWFPDCHLGLSDENILFHAQTSLAKIDSRCINLLNVICRRLMFSEVKADTLNRKQHQLNEVNDGHEELKPWTELLSISERELRERLVAFTFESVLSRVSCSASILPIGTTYWQPVGVAQMEQWITTNNDLVRDQLKHLGSEIKERERRINSVCDYVVEEKCIFCSASVPFESPEIAFCEGEKCNGATSQGHRLVRCAVSMQVCPTTPLWFCMCCQRRVSKLAPQTLFMMYKFPLDFRSLTETAYFQERSKPLCPFCGIVLQRLLPEFLLSASPV